MIVNPEFLNNAFSKLRSFEADGLVTMNGKFIRVTEIGYAFIRDISAAIDTNLWRNEQDKATANFSKAI